MRKVECCTWEKVENVCKGGFASMPFIWTAHILKRWTQKIYKIMLNQQKEYIIIYVEIVEIKERQELMEHGDKNSTAA